MPEENLCTVFFSSSFLSNSRVLDTNQDLKPLHHNHALFTNLDSVQVCFHMNLYSCSLNPRDLLTHQAIEPVHNDYA